jgi:hypothetical protein
VKVKEAAVPTTASPKKAPAGHEGTDYVVKDETKKSAARDSDNDGDDDSDDDEESEEEEEERNMLPLTQVPPPPSSDSEDDDGDDSGEMLARTTLVKAAVKAQPSAAVKAQPSAAAGGGKKSTALKAKMAPKKTESGSEEETDSSDEDSDTVDREKASRPQVSTWNLIKNVLVVSVLEGTGTWVRYRTFLARGLYFGRKQKGYLFPPPPRKSIFFPQKNSVIFAQHCRRQNSVNCRF